MLINSSPPGTTWQSQCLLEMHYVWDVIRNIDMSTHFLCTTSALVTVWAVNEKISGACQLSSRPNEAERRVGGGDLIKHKFLFSQKWSLIRMFVKKIKKKELTMLFFFFEELAQSAVNANRKSYQNVNVKLLRHTFFCQHKLWHLSRIRTHPFITLFDFLTSFFLVLTFLGWLAKGLYMCSD